MRSIIIATTIKVITASIKKKNFITVGGGDTEIL